jgi:hypothetical protein
MIASLRGWIPLIDEDHLLIFFLGNPFENLEKFAECKV